MTNRQKYQDHNRTSYNYAIDTEQTVFQERALLLVKKSAQNVLPQLFNYSLWHDILLTRTSSEEKKQTKTLTTYRNAQN